MSALDLQAYALLGSSLIGVAVLVLEHLRTRSPSQKVDERFDKAEALIATNKANIEALQTWKNN